MTNQFATVGIIGLGLIGSSIAAAVRSRRPGIRLKAHDSSADVQEQARRLNLVDEFSESAARCVAGTDLVILCVHIGAMGSVAKSIAKSIAATTIVMDVGSSKAATSSSLRRNLPDARIVPAHPVAGSERSGPAAGAADLFQDRWCILTPDEQTSAGDIQAVSIFWQSLGAQVEIMTAQEHDLVVAAISHVPHLLAFSAIAAVAGLEETHRRPFTKFAASGFRDFTRLAAANPLIWKDILLSNKAAIADVSAVFRDMAEILENLIATGDEEALLGALERVQRIRLGMDGAGGTH